ncbi:MAG: AAA family ATPase [Clostridiales bacterium]|nr:AAA family ATPase [Clostridiales bacterium]
MLKSKILIDKVNGIYADFKAEKYAVIRYNQQILTANNEFVSLENMLGKAKFSLAKSEYENNVNNTNRLKIEVKVLTEQIEEIKSKLPLIKYNYKCKICNDTGVFEGKRCKCYYKYLTQVALESLGVSEPSNSDFNSLIKDPKLIKQFKIIRNYAENFPNTQIKNLIFSGNVGTGKTELAKCVHSTVKKSENISLFLTSTELNAIFVKMHTNQVDRNLIFEVLTDADLLIIDDLGTEAIYKNVTIESLLSLVSNRIEKNKHVIITTNLNDKELLERYNERFTSRILDKTKSLFIPFYTSDFRKN